MDALELAGFAVTGMGRSRAAARTSRHDDWIFRDIPSVSPDEWRGYLGGVTLVVNASGALQTGARDDVEAIHVAAVDRLVSALEGTSARLVQISAAGVSETASTEFFRSKARGDMLIAARAPDWVILRPALVLSPDAYGGTALLRAVAALPFCVPRVFPESTVQTVHVDDLAAAVVAAAQGRVTSGTVADLTEPQGQSFPELVVAVRRWLGFPPPSVTPSLPRTVLTVIGRCADLAGHFGWRSPLRTTALRALEDGVTGDPSAWTEAGGAPCRGLDGTLSSLPATRQERLHARMYLALPLAIATLSVFWLASGVIGLFRASDALAVLDGTALPRLAREVAVIGGGLADIALGAAILWRPWTRTAAIGMVLLSCLYLAGSLVLTPALWADPLGPMVKILPGVVLALIVALTLEDR